MKILKAYLYFYLDMLIMVAFILQCVMVTIGVLIFALFSSIILDTIKRFKWQTEIERFEDKVVSCYANVCNDLLEWADKFKYLIK